MIKREGGGGRKFQREEITWAKTSQGVAGQGWASLVCTNSKKQTFEQNVISETPAGFEDWKVIKTHESGRLKSRNKLVQVTKLYKL